jgi:hypothetical protein
LFRSRSCESDLVSACHPQWYGTGRTVQNILQRNRSARGSCPYARMTCHNEQRRNETNIDLPKDPVERVSPDSSYLGRVTYLLSNAASSTKGVSSCGEASSSWTNCCLAISYIAILLDIMGRPCCRCPFVEQYASAKLQVWGEVEIRDKVGQSLSPVGKLAPCWG